MIISIDEAIACLLEGQLVALPTETVYGLAALANNESAVKSLFSLKGRPMENPLIVHCYSFEEALSHAHFDQEAIRLATLFWPGPLTLVLKSRSTFPSIVQAHLPTLALRVPSHPLFRSILQKSGPLAAPSANRSGSPSPTQPQHVEEDFGPSVPIVDGGATTLGIESTVLVQERGLWFIGREGAIPKEEIEKIVPLTPSPKLERAICPGSFFRHYAPKALLFASYEPSVEAILGFEGRSYPQNHKIYSLGSLEKPQEIAMNLYHVLRKLDQDKIYSAFVDLDFPEKGILSSVKERLSRAIS